MEDYLGVGVRSKKRASCLGLFLERLSLWQPDDT